MDKVKGGRPVLTEFKNEAVLQFTKKSTQIPWQKMLSFTKIHGKLLNTCTFILCQPYSFILTIHKKTKKIPTYK